MRTVELAATVPVTVKLLKLVAVKEQLMRLLFVEQLLVPTTAVKYWGKVTPIKLPE